MKKSSIIYKLFGITLVFFCILLGFSFFIQSFFLEDYYISKKKEELKNGIAMFSEDYLKKNWSLKDRIGRVLLFSERYNAPMIIVDENGNLKDESIYSDESRYSDTLIIRTETGEIYISNLDGLTEESDFVLAVGDDIQIYGTVLNKEKIFIDIFKIESKRGKYRNKELIKAVYKEVKNNEFPKSLEIVKVSGEIIHINNRNNYKGNRYMHYKNDLLQSEILNIFLANRVKVDQIKNDTILNYEISDKEYNKKNMIFIKPLTSKSGERIFIFVITSFQPIHEVVGIIGDFLVYVFLAALIFITFLSLIFSKIVTRSLLKINHVAEKMANLDFSQRCEIESNDEIGNLSKSINTMATNLSNSLEKLKRANVELVDDIERERKQEEERRKFIADVSHELKTPLGIIKIYAEGIQDGIYKSKKDYYLEVIVDEVEKMDNLVLDMLTISKLQSMGYKLNMKKFYIDDLINKLLEKYAHIFIEKELKVNCLCEAFDVYGDEAKIDRIIDNLLSNAVKYSKDGAKINIKTKESGELVYFYIENTGTHIPKAEIDNIWDRFYRIENSRSRLFGGTGLGLNIVKNILELHESNYGVRNTEYGVEFYFSLLKTD